MAQIGAEWRRTAALAPMDYSFHGGGHRHDPGVGNIGAADTLMKELAPPPKKKGQITQRSAGGQNLRLGAGLYDGCAPRKIHARLQPAHNLQEKQKRKVIDSPWSGVVKSSSRTADSQGSHAGTSALATPLSPRSGEGEGVGGFGLKCARCSPPSDSALFHRRRHLPPPSAALPLFSSWA